MQIVEIEMATETHGASFTLRAATNDDLDGVFTVVASSDMREFGEIDTPKEEFAVDWAELDHARDVQLAVDHDGQIVGYANCRGEGQFSGIDAEGYVHAEHEGRGVGTALVRWTEQRAADFVDRAPEGARVLLQNPTNAYNKEAAALLAGLGYDLARQFWRMQIVLSGPPEIGGDPEGISFRAARDEIDERLIWKTTEAAFAQHWGHQPRSFETWAKRRKQADHDPGLWWMAFAGNDVVGTLISKAQPGGSGWIQDVGVLPEWRQRGIGRALLQRSFAAFYERGLTTVALGVDTANATGATKVYEQAGMSITRGFSIWEKVLREGAVVPEDEDE
jgi:mycothiol synthase